jgi:hypothetical protein
MRESRTSIHRHVRAKNSPAARSCAAARPCTPATFAEASASSRWKSPTAIAKVLHYAKSGCARSSSRKCRWPGGSASAPSCSTPSNGGGPRCRRTRNGCCLRSSSCSGHSHNLISMQRDGRQLLLFRTPLPYPRWPFLRWSHLICEIRICIRWGREIIAGEATPLVRYSEN